MEERIVSVEIELAKLVENQAAMNANLSRISDTLETIVELQTSTQLLNQRIGTIDENVRDAFKRVYRRIDKIEATHRWVARTVIGTVIVSAVSSISIVFTLLK